MGKSLEQQKREVLEQAERSLTTQEYIRLMEKAKEIQKEIDTPTVTNLNLELGI